jgi:hypothetical protein
VENVLPITSYRDEKKLLLRERVEGRIKVCEGVHHVDQNAILHRLLKLGAEILVVEVDGKPTSFDYRIRLAKATNAVESPTSRTQFANVIRELGTV